MMLIVQEIKEWRVGADLLPEGVSSQSQMAVLDAMSPQFMASLMETAAAARVSAHEFCHD